MEPARRGQVKLSIVLSISLSPLVSCSGQIRSTQGDSAAADLQSAELSAEQQREREDHANSSKKSVPHPRPGDSGEQRDQVLMGGTYDAPGSNPGNQGSQTVQPNEQQSSPAGGGLGTTGGSNNSPDFNGSTGVGPDGGSPQNIAGAYLVTPSLEGCKTETGQANAKAIYSVCGVAFAASSYTLQKTASGEPSIDGISKAPLSFAVRGGIVVTTSDKSAALKLSAEQFLATVLVLKGAQNVQLAATTAITLRNNAGQVLVYGSVLAARENQPVAVESVSLGIVRAEVDWLSQADAGLRNLDSVDRANIEAMTMQGFLVGQQKKPIVNLSLTPPGPPAPLPQPVPSVALQTDSVASVSKISSLNFSLVEFDAVDL